MVLSIVRDITERKNAEAVLKESENNALIIKSMAVLANKAVNMSGLMYEVMKGIAGFIGWQMGHVFIPKRVDGNGTILRPLGIWYLEDPKNFKQFIDFIEQKSLKTGEGPAGRAYNSGSIIWLENIKIEYTYLNEDDFQNSGIKTAAVIPINAMNGIIAVLEFFSTQSIKSDTKKLELLNQFLNPVKIALERLAAEERSRKFSKAIEQNKSAIIISSKDTIIEYVNKRYSEITGYLPEEIIGRKAGEALSRPDIASDIEKTLRGRGCRGPGRFPSGRSMRFPTFS